MKYDQVNITTQEPETRRPFVFIYPLVYDQAYRFVLSRKYISCALSTNSIAWNNCDL